MNKKEFEALNFKKIDFNKNEQEKERAQEALNNLSEESNPLKDIESKKIEVLSVLRTNKELRKEEIKGGTKEKKKEEIEKLVDKIKKLKNRIEGFEKTIKFHKEDMDYINKDSEEYRKLKEIIDYQKLEVEKDKEVLENSENSLRMLLGVVNQETIIASS